MSTTLEQFLKQLAQELAQFEITATIETQTGSDAELRLLNNDPDCEEQDWHIGGAAQPGLRVRWLGQAELLPQQHEPSYLVEVNGWIVEACPHNAGWIFGCD